MLVNIGLKNYVTANHIVAVVRPNSSPIKRVIADARESHTLVDATFGRRTLSVLVMNSGLVVLSAVAPETIFRRLEAGEANDED